MAAAPHPATSRAQVVAILDALRAEAAKWGVDLTALRFEILHFGSQRDPSTGEAALTALWRGGDCGGHGGQLSLRADGHVHAECDLLIDHPRRPQFWIEAATVWGVLPALKSEPRLLEKPA